MRPAAAAFSTESSDRQGNTLSGGYFALCYFPGLGWFVCPDILPGGRFASLGGDACACMKTVRPQLHHREMMAPPSAAASLHCEDNKMNKKLATYSHVHLRHSKVTSIAGRRVDAAAVRKCCSRVGAWSTAGTVHAQLRQLLVPPPPSAVGSGCCT